MVDLARELSGTYGARLTGGGFGGTTVNLVRTSTFENFADEVRAGYQNQTGIDPEIMIVEADKGVEEYAVKLQSAPVK